MPTSYFPAAKSFDDQNQGQVDVKHSENEGYSKKMMNSIDVQEIDVNLYMSRSLWRPIGARGVFGGVIVAQSLRAAWMTVPDNFHIHSLHSYFILAGDIDIPVLYNVQRLRQGRSFATRSVTATQRGKAIFVATFSFATFSDAVNAEHFTAMPSDVPEPESVMAEDDRVKLYLNTVKDIPPHVRSLMEKRLADAQSVIYKEVGFEGDVTEMLNGATTPNSNHQRWFKTREAVESDDPKIHAGIIAYASDAGILATAAYANGLRFGGDRIGMMASLDHSIWFHQPCRADDWLLHDMHSPRSADGRGTAFGRIYSRDGTLVATTAQEGIIRLSKKEQERRTKQNKSDAKLVIDSSTDASKL
ncbi:HotDog domain-containing protein [Absidia repens]|uniref:HotDog domain-containing protein n=1 Tax=Absidia repens TaxID=90262 RepID=A0A1X2I0C4_9FUNG|nr:HotDog domain-containing protein [Absidia repens]